MEHTGLHSVTSYVWLVFQLLLYYYGSCLEVTYYVGCFQKRGYDQTGVEMTDEEMTQKRCVDYCYYNDYTYSVLSKGKFCFCHDDVGLLDREGQCTEPCPGDPGSSCGGVETFEYFSSCPQGHWGIRCLFKCNCKKKLPCSVLTGLCAKGKCDTGWYGRFCELKLEKYETKAPKVEYDMMPCSQGKFGKECIYECHCSSDLCDVYTGQCKGDCESGWHGKRCDYRHACTSNPCKNHGTCQNSGQEYFCVCPPKFAGATCAYINPCLSNPCQNGGTCTMYGVIYDCSCDLDYYGFNCEKYSPSSASSTDKVDYLGCFRFLSEESQLLHKRIWWGSDRKMTVDKCVRYCKERLYTYAGLQLGAGCWCGDDYASAGAVGEGTCNMTCNSGGDLSSKCGGRLVNSVYTVCPMGTHELDCKEQCHCSGKQCNLMTGSCEGHPCIGGWTGDDCGQAEAKPLRRTFLMVIFLCAYAGLVIILTLYDLSTRMSSANESGDSEEETTVAVDSESGQNNSNMIKRKETRGNEKKRRKERGSQIKMKKIEGELHRKSKVTFDAPKEATKPSSTAALQKTGTTAVQATGTTAEQKTSTAALQKTSTAALQATGTTPVQKTSTAALQKTGTTPVQKTSTAALQATGTTPVKKPSMAALQKTSTAALQATGTTPVQKTSTAALQATGTAASHKTSTSPVKTAGPVVSQKTSTAAIQATDKVASQKADAAVSQKASTTALQATGTTTSKTTGTATLQPAATGGKMKVNENKLRLFKLLKRAREVDADFLGAGMDKQDKKKKGKQKKGKQKKPQKHGAFLGVPGKGKGKKLGKKGKDESQQGEVTLHVPNFAPIPPRTKR